MSVTLEYQSFLREKRPTVKPFGFEVPAIQLNRHLFDWQRRVVQWALLRGRAALFEECGLGKTLQQLAWAEQVVKHTNRPVVIHTPVGVRRQTQAESERFGIGCPVTVANKQSEVRDGINLVNYEKMHLFNASLWSGVVLDESSVLKAFVGKTKQMLCDAYKLTPYRLACTATPAPNDHMELGNHSEFLGVLPSREMLSRWFVNDTMKAGGYRLRGHAKDDFWRWVSSWAVCLSKPSDIGGDDSGYQLPELRTHRHIVEAEDMEPTPGMLFNVAQISATSLYEVKRATAESRVRKAVELARNADGPCLIWCDTNDEADRLAKELPEANEVRGADSEDEKDRKMKEFSNGDCQILITKPSVAGFGMNWQHCHYQIFAGLTFSFESFYQAVRRCWRFGQTKPVDVHLVMAECDSTLEKTIGRKQADHAVMQSGMADAMKHATGGKILDELRPSESQEVRSIIIPSWMQSKGNQS